MHYRARRSDVTIDQSNNFWCEAHTPSLRKRAVVRKNSKGNGPGICMLPRTGADAKAGEPKQRIYLLDVAACGVDVDDRTPVSPQNGSKTENEPNGVTRPRH